MDGETGASSLADVADSIHAEAGATGATAEASTVDTGADTAIEASADGADATRTADGQQQAEAATDDGEGEGDDPVFEFTIGDKVEELKSSEIAELIERARSADPAGDIERIRGEVEQERTRLAESNTTFVQQVSEAALVRLNHLTGLVDAVMPQEPDIGLLRTDPDSYHEQMHVFRLFSEVKSQLDAERDGTVSSLRTAREQGGTLTTERQQALVIDEQRRLLEAMPELREPEKAKAFLTDAFGLAKELGFTQQEFDQATDHRVFRLLKMAMDGRKAPVVAKDQRATIRAKIAAKPPVARSANGQFQGNSGASEAQARVEARGGRLSDVAALIDAS